MILNKRKGVFETNSSSMHSLAIGVEASNIVDEAYNVITIGKGEYDWGPEQLTDWLEKADYFGVECSHDDDWMTGEPSEKELTPYQMERRELLTKALSRRYPNIEVEFSGAGYIDHQSRGEIWSEVFSADDPETALFNIIFGGAVIEVDNDNH